MRQVCRFARIVYKLNVLDPLSFKEMSDHFFSPHILVAVDFHFNSQRLQVLYVEVINRLEVDGLESHDALTISQKVNFCSLSSSVAIPSTGVPHVSWHFLFSSSINHVNSCCH